MQLDMVTIQGAFLHNVGALEALLHEVEPTVVWMGQPHARNQNQGILPHGRLRSSTFLKSVPVEVSLLLVDGPGRGSVVMADIQHNVWVILLS